MEDVFAKIGLKSAHLFAGMIGGVFVFYFGRKPATTREKIRAVMTVLLSAVSTGYLTPLFVQWKPGFESIEHGLAFLVGLFGMGILHGVLNVVNSFVKDPIGIFKKIKDAVRG